MMMVMQFRVKLICSIIFGFFSMFSIAYAEDIVCSAVKSVKNSNGQFGLSWEVPAEDILKSWRVEFKLNGSYITAGDIFWTFYFATADMRSKGITLSVTEALHLQIKHDGDVVTSDVPWLISGQPYTMAFQFVLFETAESVVYKGEFSIIAGEQTLSYVIEDSSVLDFCSFRQSYDNSMVTRFQNFAGAYDYSEVTLYYLSNRTIPEPSTAVLLAGSIVLLCLRRRRQR